MKKYSANTIADWFLTNVNMEAGDSVFSHLKLQKLLYYAQAWHYTLFDAPLFDDRIEAWTHGPVVISQYERFKSYLVYSPLPINDLGIEKPSIDDETEALLNDIKIIYGEHSADYLEELTHSESPWKTARGSLENHERSNNEITLGSMKEYYSKLMKHGE